MLVTVIDLVAPVSFPTMVNCVDLPADVEFSADKGNTPILTVEATRVLLLGTSSSPKKNGVVAPAPVVPAACPTFILTTLWSCKINVYDWSDTLAVVGVTVTLG